jgi:hypothetical protein
VGATEGLIQFGSSLGVRDRFEQSQDGADMLQMLGVLALKDGGELLADGGQSR